MFEVCSISGSLQVKYFFPDNLKSFQRRVGNCGKKNLIKPD